MTRLTRFPIVVCLFVCPLLFFTNLTRNPYVTQISLMNIGIAAAAMLYFLGDAWENGELRLPRTPIDAPMAGWIAVCVLSWSIAYVGHRPFFRPSIIAEGARNFFFVLINAAAAFYLSVACSKSSEGEELDQAGKWAAFALVWGCLWLAFPQLHTRPGPATEIWSQISDGYGFFLWSAGLAGAFWLCRRGRITDYVHLSLAVGFLASLYGIFQYFNIELIWPNILTPYGGRSVSTFGNPNFISSYSVILIPFSVVLFLEARTNAHKLIYGVTALALEAELLCSLTRSSWGGALVAVGALAFSADLRRKLRENPQVTGMLVAASLAMVFFWPQSAVGGNYTPSVLSRITEIKTFAQREGFYSPFHQRVLIWSCAWLMGAENPLLGKGWGLLELFYPFYQGHLLDKVDFFIAMRTHANNGHNEIMEFWAQTGILGVGVLFWLWTLFAVAAKSHWTGGRVKDQALGLAASASVFGMLADNLLNVSLHFAVPAFMFWWAAGIAMSRMAQADGQWRVLKLGRMKAVLAAAALSVLLSGISWYWVSVWYREAHYFAGFKLLRQGAMPAAVRELEISRAWGPREVNAIYELGNAYARSERYDDAIATYHQALDANAGYDEIYFNIGTILSSKMRQPEEAAKYFNEAWFINPLSNELYMNLGSLYLRDPARYRKEATALLERAAHFFPNDPNHWNNLGYLYSLGGDLGGAENAYVHALRANPDMKIAETNLQNALRQSHHRPPEVLAGLEELRRTEAMIVKGDYTPRTLELARHAAELLPTVPKARFFYGSLLLANGHAPEAVEPLEWVVGREPKNTTAWANLGAAYAASGRRDQAVSALKTTLILDPQNAVARQRLQALGASQ